MPDSVPDETNVADFVTYEEYLAGAPVADLRLLRRYRMLEDLPDLCQSDDEEAAVFLVDDDAEVMTLPAIRQAFPALQDAPDAEIERLRTLAAGLLERGWVASAKLLN